MPHTSISIAQNARRNARVASGKGKWSSSLQDELQYIVDDFTNAGFSNDTINQVLEHQSGIHGAASPANELFKGGN